MVPSDSTYSNTLLPIVSLDLGTESYQQILPPDYGEKRVTLKMGVLRDCLCILANHKRQMVSDIWLMKEFGNRESWTKLVTVPYMRYSEYLCYIDNVLYISEDDQVLLEFLNGLKSELVIYDPINGTLKHQNIENFNDLRHDDIYVESLISPYP